MKWSPRTVYLYLVSFSALLMLVFGSVLLVNGLIAWFEPQTPYSPGRLPIAMPLLPGEIRPQARETALHEAYEELNPGLTAAQIASLVRDRLETEDRYASADSIFRRVRRLAQSATLVLLAFPAYLYHWRRAQRSL